ncbi:MAG: Bro-N domain-containing protein [Comamonas sp.]
MEIDGEPWFVGKDVADALGYADPTTAMRSHCRGVQKLHPISDTLGRMQETRLISEPDMLRLIVNSTLPAAERFERWVFEDVLPSIRKTGSYIAKGALTPLKATAEAAKVQVAQGLVNFRPHPDKQLFHVVHGLHQCLSIRCVKLPCPGPHFIDQAASLGVRHLCSIPAIADGGCDQRVC